MIYKFDPVIYPRKIWVSIGKNDLSDFENVEPFSEDSGADSQPVLNVVDNQCGILIRFRSKSGMTPNYIAHEASHAAMDIFNDCDCMIDVENQEPFAYLLGAIVEFIHSCKK